MGWFNQDKKKAAEEKKEIPELPKLPPLPKLPEFPKLELPNNSLPQLPTFPLNSFGEKRGEGVFDEAKFERQENKFATIQKPLDKFPKEDFQKRKFPSEKDREIRQEISHHVKESGPVFIRLDKFEESLKMFEKAREKIAEIEKILNRTKRTKEEEEKELESWENEINMIKEKLENIDKNIFSKLE